MADDKTKAEAKAKAEAAAKAEAKAKAEAAAKEKTALDISAYGDGAKIGLKLRSGRIEYLTVEQASSNKWKSRLSAQALSTLENGVSSQQFLNDPDLLKKG